MIIKDLATCGKKYQVIYADPPWEFGTWGKTGWKAPQRHYNCLPLLDIIAFPIEKLADKDCVLFLWTTYPALQQSFYVIEGWGFHYSTIGFTWVKTTKNGKYHYGLGFWTRANPEVCLLATKGHPKRINKGIAQLVVSPVREHSKKPDEVRERIVTLMGNLPRIELFARQQIEGWDCWGDEV